MTFDELLKQATDCSGRLELEHADRAATLMHKLVHAARWQHLALRRIAKDSIANRYFADQILGDVERIADGHFPPTEALPL